MQEPSLEGCREKLRRASAHLECLDRKLGDFNDSQPYSVDEKFNPQTRKYKAWFKAPENPDELLWGVIVGDYVHNLRSALDQLVGQLSLLSDRKKVGGNTQYPIAGSGTEYWCATKDGQRSMRDWMLGGVDEKFRTIIDATQPYRAGQSAKREPLAVLNWLSNIDKHRFIHPTWTFLGTLTRDMFRVIGDAAEETALEIDAETGALQDGAKILTVLVHTKPPDAEVEVKGFLPIGIGFGERRGGRGGIPHTELVKLGQRAEGIIEAFAGFFQPPAAH